MHTITIDPPKYKNKNKKKKNTQNKRNDKQGEKLWFMLFHLIILSINEKKMRPLDTDTLIYRHRHRHRYTGIQIGASLSGTFINVQWNWFGWTVAGCWLLVIRILSRLNRSNINDVPKCINMSCMVNGRLVVWLFSKEGFPEKVMHFVHFGNILRFAFIFTEFLSLLYVWRINRERRLEICSANPK